MFGRFLLALCCAAACAVADTPPLLEQSTPTSVWLDFAALARTDAENPAVFPAWCEGLQTIRVPATDQEPPKTIHRLRLRRLPDLQRQMLFRVMFDDIAGLQPTVSAWTETGRELFRSPPLGTALGLATQEDVILPLAGTDYIDLEVVGNASNIRGALVSALREQLVPQALDFLTPAKAADPFGNRPPLLLDVVDTRLFGRVKATLDTETVRLTHGATEHAEWAFDLEAQPLAAIVSFEVLDADLTAPPTLIANNGASLPVTIHWPDLADPGFRGEARGGEARLRFHYTGWLRAQVVITGGDLKVGLNNLAISLSEQSGAIAIRNVELQLKQNWKHFDYILTPDR